MKISPIVLFAYNRPDHTRVTLSSLSKNTLCSASDIYIYLDFPKKESDQQLVKDVLIACAEFTHCFKNFFLIERSYNYGLAANISSGVSEVVKKYGKVIVLEDDLLLSPFFLDYMNSALNIYHDNSKVWHISGWNYPARSLTNNESYFLPVMNCWGWGTWADRWVSFDKNPNALLSSWGFFKIFRFNLYGLYDFWKQVRLNHNKKINTWAIFWYATIFEHDGLCLNPKNSYVKNIGLDGSGENCSSYNPFRVFISEKKCDVFPDENIICKKQFFRVKLFYLRYKLNIFSRVLYRIKDRILKIN